MALAALACAVVAGATIVAAFRLSLPVGHGRLEIRGPSGAVIDMRFDALARPYVRAGTLEDALYAQGWLHGRDRAWQMELLRRAGSGRLAELLGPGLLETDRELWRAGVPQLARRLAGPGRGAAGSRIEAYVAGINAGLAELRMRPPEFILLAHAPRPWTAADVYAVGAAVAWDSAGNLDNELLRLALRARLDAARFAAFLPAESAGPAYPLALPPATAIAAAGALDALAVAGRPSTAFGSNGWAVAPRRTRAGRALFAFDSHDALSQPTLFYEVHLFFGDGRQVRGWSLPGLPGVINGYNEYWSWGLTNTGDTQDLYLLDAAVPVVRREAVSIAVRGRSQPDRLVVEYTEFGPVIHESPRLALAWTGHAVRAGGIDALLALNLATDLDAIETAFRAYQVPTTNATWATQDGHVGFRTLGTLPLRAAGEGLYPQPALAATRWLGLVPTEENPARLDPAEGYVAAANARVNARGDGPLVSADNAAAYRIRRIQSVLAARADHDLESMAALQGDWWNGQAEQVLPWMLPALDALPDDASTLSAARRVLRDWRIRPVNAPDSAAARLFEQWYLQLAAEVFAAALGPELWARLLKRNYVLNDALDRLLTEPGSPWWAGHRDDVLRASFRAAVTDLERESGSDVANWRWDERHRVILRHELGKAVPVLGHWLDRGPFPWGGSAATVGRAGDRYDRPGIVNHAATVRVVGEWHADGLRAAAIMAAGQSGHPSSPHYDDQTPLWLARQLQPVAHDPGDVPPPP